MIDVILCASMLLVIVLSCKSHSRTQPSKLNLMPSPSKMEVHEGVCPLTEAFTVQVIGNPHKRIYGGATRMLRRLSNRTGLFFEQGIVTPKTKFDNPVFYLINGQ